MGLDQELLEVDAVFLFEGDAVEEQVHQHGLAPAEGTKEIAPPARSGALREHAGPPRLAKLGEPVG
jgi:hypothetical protein